MGKVTLTSEKLAKRKSRQLTFGNDGKLTKSKPPLDAPTRKSLSILKAFERQFAAENGASVNRELSLWKVGGAGVPIRRWSQRKMEFELLTPEGYVSESSQHTEMFRSKFGCSIAKPPPLAVINLPQYAVHMLPTDCDNVITPIVYHPNVTDCTAKYNLGVFIARSNIPNAGFGLFADRNLVAGTAISFCGGRHAPAVGLFNPYITYLSDGSVYDELRQRSLASFVNDPRNINDELGGAVLTANCTLDRTLCPPVIQLAVDVPRGSELLVDYGNAYWCAWGEARHTAATVAEVSRGAGKRYLFWRRRIERLVAHRDMFRDMARRNAQKTSLAYDFVWETLELNARGSDPVSPTCLLYTSPSPRD